MGSNETGRWLIYEWPHLFVVPVKDRMVLRPDGIEVMPVSEHQALEARYKWLREVAGVVYAAREANEIHDADDAGWDALDALGAALGDK